MSKRLQLAIVLFGGVGTRFDPHTPKQFIKMGDRPLMVHTLQNLAASPEIDKMIVVSAPEYVEQTAEVIAKYHCKKISCVISGGNSREASALKALDYLYKEGISFKSLIMIHDGDRPNVNLRIIAENYKVALENGCAITAINPPDAIAYSYEGIYIDRYIDKHLAYLVQTPQTFRFDILYFAMVKAANAKLLNRFPDEGKLMDYYHYKLKYVQGDPNNYKITTRIDGDVFEANLRRGAKAKKKK